VPPVENPSLRMKAVTVKMPFYEGMIIVTYSA
jgi:hypothetical protein